MHDIFVIIFEVLCMFIFALLAFYALICFALGLNECFKCIYDTIENCVENCFNKPEPKTNGVCTICLEDVRSFPLECGHVFHNKCILKWLKDNDTCPNCRMELV